MKSPHDLFGCAPLEPDESPAFGAVEPERYVDQLLPGGLVRPHRDGSSSHSLIARYCGSVKVERGEN